MSTFYLLTAVDANDTLPHVTIGYKEQEEGTSGLGSIYAWMKMLTYGNMYWLFNQVE